MDGVILTIFAACLGAALGSFANAAATRTVAGRKWWGRERSVCDCCGRTLTAAELIPIVSYVLLHGRCRTCGARIHPRHIAAEIAGAALAALFAVRFGASIALAFAIVSLPFIIFHSATDIESGYLFDSWTLAMAICAAALRATGGMHALLDGFLGALAGFCIIGLIILISRGGMGTGDAVLMAGIGALVGIKLTIIALYIGFILCCAVTLPLLAARKVTRKTHVPLAPFLLAGMAAAMIFGEKILYFSGFLTPWPWNVI